MTLDPLAPITQKADYFALCAFKGRDSPPETYAIFSKIQAQIQQANTESLEETLPSLVKKYPELLVSIPTNMPIFHPLIHSIACYPKLKNLLKLCIDLSGQNTLEVGDSHNGETPIFGIWSYKLLKRLTDLGANVNVLSSYGSVLEYLVTLLPITQSYALLERDRCIKHLIRLGACIQEKSFLLEGNPRKELTAVYTKFLEEVETVKKKIAVVVELRIFAADLQPLIFDYAWGEEDSETPVYDENNLYLLDDETEAYAYIKKNSSIPHRSA